MGATSWVNTWEYSMFKVDQTTHNLFKRDVRKVKESCGDNWTLTDDVENKIKVGSFLGNVNNQIVSSQTGVDVKGNSGISSDILSDAKTKLKQI